MKEGRIYKELGDICEVEYGTRVVQARDGGSVYPVYGGGGATFMMDTFNREDRVVVSRFAMSPKCTRSVTGKFFLNDSGLTLKSTDSVLSQDYLDSYMLSNNDKIYTLGRGLAQKNLKVEDLLKLQIYVPSQQQQNVIVSELNNLNKLIALKKKQIEDLETLSQSIFYEMFGDPVVNEKNWDVKKLGEISTLISNGNTPKGGSEVYVEKGYLFLRSQNVWKNRLELDDVAFIDAQTHTKLKKSILMHNDLLITKTGRINTENSSLGRTALFDGEDGSANINGHVYLVRLKKGMMHKFVLYILISNAYRELIRKTCVGGIDKRQLNRNHIEDFPIIFPPMDLQSEYVKRVEIIEHQKSLLNSTVKDLETLLASRMQYWFD